MKNIILLSLSLFVGSGIFFSCSDIEFGDEFLGSQPESSGATLDTMFSSTLNSEKVLARAYYYLPYGIPTEFGMFYKLGGNLLAAITDEATSFRDNIADGPVNLYYNGALSPNISSQIGSENYRYGYQSEYYAIRYAWIYIENISKVPDMNETLRSERIAEAKMIIALCYAEMLRYLGGVPLIDHSVDPNEEMIYPRATFSETVEYIIQLLDEAIPHLKWKQDAVNDGRMSKAGAMALKIRVLLFAASPTFNSNTSFHAGANEYHCYTNFDNARWQRALEAGEEFMTELNSNGQYGLIQPTLATHEGYRQAYQKAYYDRGGTEVLISTRRGFDADTHSRLIEQRNYTGINLNYVNMFPWADGTDFPENFDWENPLKQPFYEEGTLQPTRDPRLYETVAVPGSRYVNGTFANVYVNHANFRAGGSGFLVKKFLLEYESDRAGRPVQWPYLRLPEVLLSCAEAINEYNNGPNAVAYDLVNQVRARVGLSNLNQGMSKEEFRDAVIHERALELGFEEVRWFDMVRWGREDIFREKLYGLTSIADIPSNPTQFTFIPYELPVERHWISRWDTKWYLAPIPQEEINKNYGMTQNPGW